MKYLLLVSLKIQLLQKSCKWFNTCSVVIANKSNQELKEVSLKSLMKQIIQENLPCKNSNNKMTNMMTMKLKNSKSLALLKLAWAFSKQHLEKTGIKYLGFSKLTTPLSNPLDCSQSFRLPNLKISKAPLHSMFQNMNCHHTCMNIRCSFTYLRSKKM